MGFIMCYFDTAARIILEAVSNIYNVRTRLDFSCILFGSDNASTC